MMAKAMPAQGGENGSLTVVVQPPYPLGGRRGFRYDSCKYKWTLYIYNPIQMYFSKNYSC